MKLHELKIASRQNTKRLGRGIGSGRGKTAGRGTKGQLSRTGSGRKSTFEGGQNALVHRLPKLRGFTSRRPSNQLIYTDQLNHFKDNDKLNRDILHRDGLIDSVKRPVKLLQRGELTKKVHLEIHGASAKALDEVTKKGGSVTMIVQKAPPKAE